VIAPFQEVKNQNGIAFRRTQRSWTAVTCFASQVTRRSGERGRLLPTS